MARSLYTILLVFALAFSGAMPSMAMVSDGHSQMAFAGLTMHVMQGGMAEATQQNSETSDLDGSCGKFCLECGCMSCETRILSGRADETMVAIDRFPSPHRLGQAPRVDQDVAKPPPKA